MGVGGAIRQEVTVRGFAIGIALGAIATMFWMIESVRRRAEPRTASARLWPRPDGSVRSFGEVWEFHGGEPVRFAAAGAARR